MNTKESCTRGSCNCRTNISGTSFIEVLLAIVLISILALGALGYQYNAIKQVGVAKAATIAVRIGRLIIEDFKSTGASEDYTPVDLELGFETADQPFDYRINVDNLDIFINISQQQIDEDISSGVILRQINVSIQWPWGHQSPPNEDDPSLLMATYVRMDATGG